MGNDNASMLKRRIAELKKEKNAVILAHNYQIPEVQDIADYTGDSLGLSKKAAGTEAEVIVFCGVKFMAESAKLLSPEKQVLLPEEEAGCPLAGMVDIASLKKKKKEYPEAAVVTYVNSTAAVKAESDVCCTSSNAVEIVNSIDSEQILFVPDRNLGNYVSDRTEKEIIIWEGYCPTHDGVRPQEVKEVRKKHPQAPILVHPECDPEVVELADYVGSTAGILEFAQKSSSNEIVIGTEKGLIHRLQKENPEKDFYLLSSSLICPNMKKINLEKIKYSLENTETLIELSEEISHNAQKALDKMLELTS